MVVKVLENYELCSDGSIECDAFVYFHSAEPRSGYISDKYSIESAREFVLFSSDLKADDNAFCVVRELGLYLKDFDESVTLVLDISCMPREYMAELLALFSSVKTKEIELITIYALAAFSPPSKDSVINEAIEPVHQRFAGWSTPDSRPTSLILGLGYEPDRAEGASEFFEPSDQWIFVPKSPVAEFFEKVAQNNRALLLDVGNKNVIEYNVLNPSLTFAQLEMVVGLLLDKTNPVLLPFGPKIFFFLCLIQCLQHPKIGVWHFSNKNILGIQNDLDASGDVAIMRCVLG